MIREYNRPTKIEEALALLSRPEMTSVPIGGGTAFDRSFSREIAVVDLQLLGLNTIRKQGNSLLIGATVTLQNLADEIKAKKLVNLAGLEQAIGCEATYNLRQAGTVAGALVAADGRSPFTTAMMALDAELMLEPGGVRIGLGDLLPFRSERLYQRLITSITIPLNARLAYEYVARSPADRPIVCASVAAWSSGRSRVALGGYGGSPILAFDGGEANGIEIAARNAYNQAGDEWASAEYRREIAGILARRCVIQINETNA